MGDHRAEILAAFVVSIIRGAMEIDESSSSSKDPVKTYPFLNMNILCQNVDLTSLLLLHIPED